jgi:transposase
MKYRETQDYSFFLGENHFIYDHKEDKKTLRIYVKSKPHSSKCPKCGKESTVLHATYQRILQDCPIHCK